MRPAVELAAVVVRRTIAASPEELFDAWLDPQALAVWMRPTGIRTTHARTEARVGGSFEIVMHGEDAVHRHCGAYEVIDRPRRLVFTWASPATAHVDTRVTVDFLPHEQRTEIVITHELLPPDARDSHRSGWTSALERFATLRGHGGTS